jgi:hypothetical protein
MKQDITYAFEHRAQLRKSLL